MSDECKKFQWSKFNEDRSEQFVIRTENWQEIVDYRVKVNVLVAPRKEEQTVAEPTQTTQAPQGTTHMCTVHSQPLIYKEGTSKAGKPYKVWSCPVKMPNGSFCDQKEWVK